MDTRIIKRITIFGFAIIIGCLFYYQVIRGDYYLEKSRANYIRVIPYRPIRGSIMDINGEILARDVPSLNIAVVPYQIRREKKALFSQISRFLGLPEKDIEASYRKNVKNPFSPVSIIINIKKSSALKLKDKFGDKIIIKSVPRRFYPFSYEMSHILGYVKSAAAFYGKLKAYGYTPYGRVGFLGVEQYYDSYLRGKSGGQLIAVDSGGRMVGFLGENIPQKGKDITLTIDVRMQKAAYRALSGYRGAIILMNPYNGGISVLCSRPSYNVNDVARGLNVKRILNDRRRPFINRAIQAVYPPGSVFKPIVAIGALEDGAIKKNTTFNCKGYLMVGGRKFSCWGVHGIQNLTEAITHSCDVYFYNVGLKLGVDKISKWAEKFGLGRLTGIGLPYEKKGAIPTAKWKERAKGMHWFKGDTANLSIGQGYLEVTPIQVVTAISAFANGGYIVRPHIIHKIGGMPAAIVKKKRIRMASYNLKIVQAALRSVVSNATGTAHSLDSLGLDIAGKTGTAQNSGKPHGWFEGFFPYNKPEYSICVFIQNGGSSYEALKVAYKFLSELEDEGLINKPR